MTILDFLSQLRIESKLYEHEPFFTCEDAEKFYGDVEGGESKNLFLRDRKGEQHYLVVLESHKRLDLNKFGESLGERLSFGSPERLKKWLNVTPGAVSPLNLIFDEANHIKVFVDVDLFDFEWLYYHPGRNDQTLQIRSADLKKFLDAVGNEWKTISALTVPSE